MRKKHPLNIPFQNELRAKKIALGTNNFSESGRVRVEAEKVAKLLKLCVSGSGISQSSG